MLNASMTSPYAVLWLHAAEKDTRALPRSHEERLYSLVSRLATEPRPPAARPKHGGLKGLLGIACGRFRILYRIDDARHRVEIARVRHRKEAYR